jgi:hypothetical protein
MRTLLVRLATVAVLAACGPTRVNVAPVQVQPIHVTIDVNLHDPAQPPRK